MLCIDKHKAATMFRAVLTEKCRDRIMGLVHGSPGWKAQQLAIELEQWDWQQDSLYVCVEQIVKLVTACVEIGHSGKFSSAGMLKLHGALITRRLDPQLTASFTDIIQKRHTVDESTCKRLFQHVVDGMAIKILQHVNSAKPMAESIPEVNSVVTLEEQQVLYYAVGYIPLKLLRKYNRFPHNKAAILYKDIVSSWCSAASDLPPALTLWITAQDRGGLQHVSAPFYAFLLLVEQEIRRIINKDNLGQFANKCIVTEVITKLKSQQTILSGWYLLTGMTIDSDDLMEGLLDDVLKCWASSKGHQAVRSFVFDQKQKKTGPVARMGLPALRKILDKH